MIAPSKSSFCWLPVVGKISTMNNLWEDGFFLLISSVIQSCVQRIKSQLITYYFIVTALVRCRVNFLHYLVFLGLPTLLAIGIVSLLKKNRKEKKWQLLCKILFAVILWSLGEMDDLVVKWKDPRRSLAISSRWGLESGLYLESFLSNGSLSIIY